MLQFFKVTICLFGWTIFSVGTLTAETDSPNGAKDLGIEIDGMVVEGKAVPKIAATPTTPAPAVSPAPAPKVTAPAPAPHCEVPCGIYTDQLRFEQMLEDTKTIAKAIDSVNEIAGAALNAKTMNQVSRWVANKESHATNTQHIVAQYFLTQRIKSDNKDYAKQLAAAHKVMVSAMKCKQDANAETAKTLKAAIFDLYRAYEGKEPKFHEHEKK